jgi:hypothetical protein
MRQRENRSLPIAEPTARRGGRSNGQSAVDEGTGGDPSSRIPSTAEVIRGLAKCQQYALCGLPYAIRVIADATRSENPRVRLSAAIKLCEIAGVPQSGSIEQALETTAAVDQRQEERRLIFLGSVMDMMLNKFKTYKISLPRNSAKDLNELNTRVQELVRQVESEEELAPLACRMGPVPSSSPEQSREQSRP